MKSPPDWLRLSLVVLLTGLVGTILFLYAVSRDLNHDEHQFIAPGVLISREGLLPYRDFPMFHLPTLAFAYAGLDRLTHQPILSAKVLSALSSTGIAALILLVASASSLPDSRRGLWIGAAVVLLFVSDPLFTFTAGKTWNHEVPSFLLVLAIVFEVQAVTRGSWLLFGASGCMAGLAVGTRLTFAPAALALPLAILFAPLPRRQQISGMAIWSLAGLISLAPCWYFLAFHREQFLFDNLAFPRLRLADPSDTRVQKTMVWWRKLRFFGKEVLERSGPLAIAFIAAALLPIWTKIRAQRRPSFALIAVALALPAALIGCFLPSRFQYQHYFVVLPLACLGIAYACAELRRWQIGIVLGAALVAASGIGGTDPGKKPSGVRAYREVGQMLHRDEWFTERLRMDYAKVGRNDKVLTLSPAPVLEMGARIYPEFATGPFAWRAAHLVPTEKRAQLKFVSADDLEAFLKDQAPDAILTGVEDEILEKAFITYAQSHGYASVKLGRQRVLWTPSSPRR